MENNRKPTALLLVLGLVIIVLVFGAVFFVYSLRSDRSSNVAMAPASRSEEYARAEQSPRAALSAPRETPSPIVRQEYLAQQEAAEQTSKLGIEKQKRQTGSSRLSRLLPSPTVTPLPVPATRENILRTDRALEELASGNIAFTAPNSIQLEETGQVQLLLGLSQSIEELKKALEQQAVVEGAKIRVSDHMEAILSGAGFEIVPITPPRQAVSEKEATEWKWDVKAREPGRRRLHLALNAVLPGDSNGGTRLLRTFDKDIEVTVTMRQRIGGFFIAHEFGSTFVAGLLVLALGWTSAKLYERAVGRRKKRKRETGKGRKQREKSRPHSDDGSK